MITVSTFLQIGVAKRKTQLTVRAFALEQFFVGRQLKRVLVSRRGHVTTERLLSKDKRESEKDAINGIDLSFYNNDLSNVYP